MVFTITPHGSLPGLTPGRSQACTLLIIASLAEISPRLLSFIFQFCVSVLSCFFSFVFHSHHAVTLIFSILVPRAAIISSCTTWTFVFLHHICEEAAMAWPAFMALFPDSRWWQLSAVTRGSRGEFPLLEACTVAGACVQTRAWLELVRKPRERGQRKKIEMLLFFFFSKEK